MRWHKPKRGIKPYIKELRVIISWVGLFNDKVSLERLNQAWLLYLMNMSFNGMCCRLWKLENMCMWLLRTFRVQRIISTTLPKIFEMYKHNGYETQTKNWILMWKAVYWDLGNHNGMDLILIGHMKMKWIIYRHKNVETSP